MFAEPLVEIVDSKSPGQSRMHELASDDDHVNTVEPPAVMLDGLIENETEGNGLS